MFPKLIIGLMLGFSANILITAEPTYAAESDSPVIVYETSIVNLTHPKSVAVSEKTGNIYVTVSGSDPSESDVIKVFDKNYQPLPDFGSTGTGNGQFRSPLGMTFDTFGNMYVGENIGNRIQKFTSDGTYISKFGSSGTDSGEFNFVEGLGIDSEGYLYVADGVNGRIQKFTTDGIYISEFGTSGIGDGELSYVEALAINSRDEIYVTDGNNHVQKYDSDGNHLAQIDGLGTDAGAFVYAEGLAIDEKDNVYIVDNAANNIHVFNRDNEYLTTIGGAGSAEGEFSSPYYSAYQGGKLYIADLLNDRVQIFAVHQPVPLEQSSAVVNGKSLQGKPTIKKKPTFSGTAPAGSTVRVTVHSDPVTCTTTAAEDGSWSCTLSESLPAGQHSVRVLVTTLDSQTYELGPYIVLVAGSTISGILAPDAGVRPANDSSPRTIWLISLLFISLVALSILSRTYSSK